MESLSGVKLENENRESVSVTDWCALAVALDVPPDWLLVDPSGATPTPVPGGAELDPWSALLWMSGREHLEGRRPTSSWDTASRAMHQVQLIISLVGQFAVAYNAHAINSAVTPAAADPQADQDAAERRILLAMVDPLRDIVDRGYAPVPLPPLVQQRAAELGVDLPTVED